MLLVNSHDMFYKFRPHTFRFDFNSVSLMPSRAPGSAAAATMTDKHKLCNINVIEAFFINLLIYTNQIRPEALTPCNILQTLQQLM